MTSSLTQAASDGSPKATATKVNRGLRLSPSSTRSLAELASGYIVTDPPSAAGGTMWTEHGGVSSTSEEIRQEMPSSNFRDVVKLRIRESLARFQYGMNSIYVKWTERSVPDILVFAPEFDLDFVEALQLGCIGVEDELSIPLMWLTVYPLNSIDKSAVLSGREEEVWPIR